MSDSAGKSWSTVRGVTHPARRLWQLIEAINGVTYFAPRCRSAMDELGLKGFWMGYFASRAAPFGAVGPGLVEATFYNFSPSLVRRAIPDAWRFATPAAIIGTRATAAADVLRDAVPGIEADAPRIVPLLTSAVRSGRPDGRPLFAANQALPLPEDPVAALWQCCTSLREHRGDGHVAALVAADISGIESHQLIVGSGYIADEPIRASRGWDEDDWLAAKDRLRARGLIDDTGALTTAGQSERERIEAITDELAMQPYRDGLTEAGLDLLPSLLRPMARAIRDADILVFPNPMGLEPAE
jgi:hypothetical protein